MSVGYAADYQDKCLITVVVPEFHVASQFLQTGGESPLGPFRQEQVEPAALPASVKQWNATLGSEGTLTL